MRKLKVLILVIVLLSLIPTIGFAGECKVSSLNDFTNALNKAQNKECNSSSADLRTRYGEFYPGQANFQVIVWDKTGEYIVETNLPSISNSGTEPLVIYAKSETEVKLVADNVGTGLNIIGEKIIIDNIEIEGFKDVGIKISGNKNLVIRSSIKSNQKTGIEITGKQNKVVDAEVFENGHIGIVIGNVSIEPSCSDIDADKGKDTIVLGVHVHDNGLLVDDSNCSELNDSINNGTCLSLKREAEKCYEILDYESECEEEPTSYINDDCGKFWANKNRCKDLWQQTDITENSSEQDVIDKIYESFLASADGFGILVDAKDVKIASWQPRNSEIPKKYEQGIYASNDKYAIYVNSVSPNILCEESNESFVIADLHKALISEIPVNSIFISRFSLPTPRQLAVIPGLNDITISGSIILSRNWWSPWNATTISLDNLKVEVFVRAGDSGDIKFIGSGSLDNNGRFQIQIPHPIQINDELILDPKFLISIIDEDWFNTSNLFLGNSTIGADADDDGDGILNSDEDINHNGEIDAGETDPLSKDTDADGLTDKQELEYVGLDPLNPDSDGDCIPDGLELGITENTAKSIIESLPVRPKLSLTEKCADVFVDNGQNILKNAILYDDNLGKTLDNIAMLFDLEPETKTDPTKADTDSDGLTDGAEDKNFNGKVDYLEDIEAEDLEELEEADEVYYYDENIKTLLETDPNLADTDEDGLIDGMEGDKDNDGVLGIDETDPLISDTDSDGINDGQEQRFGTYANKCDSDDDGLSDGIEKGFIKPNKPGVNCHGLEASGTNYFNINSMDPLNPDSDADGLLDGEEDINFNGWIDTFESDPSISDTDRDGLLDGIEAKGDFDGDGFPDFDFTLIKAGRKCTPPETITDLDCDGIPNWIDVDSDEDGCPDSEEGTRRDSNTNNIPDVYDNEATSCSTPSSGSNGGGSFSISGTGTTGDQEEIVQAQSQRAPLWLSDQSGGSACSLNPNKKAKLVNINFALFIIILILLCHFRSNNSPGVKNYNKYSGSVIF